jgi:hypothetical protein
MLNPSGAPIGLRYKAYSASGIAVSCMTAIAILGLPGILANLIFMPLQPPLNRFAVRTAA